MPTELPDYRYKALIRHSECLLQEYDAIWRQLDTTLNPEDRVKLQRSRKEYEKVIDELDCELRPGGPDNSESETDRSYLCRAPRPPASLVHRTDLYKNITNALVTSDVRDYTRIVALRGTGGFGKTTLAQAPCRDKRVWAHFPNRILWIRLGHHPDPVRLATLLSSQFTGKRPKLLRLGDAPQSLSQILRKKRCLLVVDDAWNEADARLFPVEVS